MNENFESSVRVAFFDSGIGGLNLLAECARRLPQADFTYFADNFNMPYGNLSEKELFFKADIFFEKISLINPHAAVIACNTVTAACAGKLRAKYSFPIVGVEPAVKPAASRCKSVLVLATAATAKSAALFRLLQKYGGGRARVVACPKLAEYIERNIFQIDEREVTKMLPKCSPDGVVLGCTHYSYVKNIIKNFYGCEIFDGLEGTAGVLESVLSPFLPQTGGKMGEISFCGGDGDKNREVFSLIFPK